MENQALQPDSVHADKAQSFPSAVRVAIVEDMQFLAESLGHLCRQQWGLDVVALCHTGNQGYADIVRTRPDVVLLDLGLPDLDGITLGRRINDAAPEVRIIMISGAWSDYQVHRLRAVRFQGFVDKFDDELMRLRQAIELVAQGGNYFSPRYLTTARRLRCSGTACFKLLSLREQEVLILAVQALSDMEIAIQLHLSATTAQTHRRKIMRKLNLHSTPKLIRYGMEMGLGHEPLSRLPPQEVESEKCC